MEENKIETEMPSQTPIVFPPHRRRHLNSGTYRTLVRIFSHFSDESQHSVADQTVAPELNQDNGSNESVQEAEKEVPENFELVGPDSTKVRVADESCDDNDFRERIEQIESLLSVEENEDFSGLKDAIDIENILAIDLKDMGFLPEQMLVDAPELVVKGNHEPSDASLDQNQNGGDKAALLTNEEHVETVASQDSVQMVSVSHGSSLNTVEVTESLNPRESSEHEHSLSKTSTLDVEPIMQPESMELETSVSAKGARESSIPITEVGAIKETEIFSQKIPEAFDFSLNKDMVAEASKPTDYSKDKSSSRETNSLEVDHEMQEKFKELEETVCDITAMNSTNHMGDGDIEEGEISGDDGMDDRSSDVLLQDTVVVEEKKVHEGQIFKDVIDRKEQPCKEANDKDFGSGSFLVDVVEEGKIGRGVELRESSRTDMICNAEVVQGQNVNDSNPLLNGGRIEMKDNRVEMGIGCSAAGNNGTASEEKWDAAGACNKRKRGPPNKEKKERKKAKDRKKRAEKNRELGVKRLKLQPIQKTKTVAYCRHYLNGKCNLGDQCKYSHDTVPLTKSTPCGKFARNECMKGDDCGYDHELSKYPCHNFRDNGFCGRGDSCLFSHKMPSKEESETAACKPELKPRMVQSNSRSQEVNISGASQQNVHALGFSTGIHSHNNTKQNATENVLKQPELATKGISFPSIPKSSLVHSSMPKQGGLTPDRNMGTKAGSQIDQSPLSSVQNSNEILKRTPPVTTPKGINFLSFGKASPDVARGKSQVSHQTNPGVSGTVQNSNGMLKSDKTAASRGTSFNPFRKSSVASSTGGQNLNWMLQINQPAALQGTSFNPFENSSVASSSGGQNLNGMLRDNQPAASQGTSSNPFEKSLVASSGSDQNLKGFKQASQLAASQGTSFNPFGKSLVTSSSSDQNLNGMLQNNQPATLQGTSINPFGKSSVTSSSSDQNLRGILQANQPSASQGTRLNPFEKSLVSISSTSNPVSLTSCGGNGSDRDTRESQNTADNSQKSSAASLRLPSSPITSGQSSDHVASRFCKGTANSFQRGLFSTLAFAAKYKAQNMNQSIGSTSTQVDKGN